MLQYFYNRIFTQTNDKNLGGFYHAFYIISIEKGKGKGFPLQA
jgi:hypothetical protein